MTTEEAQVTPRRPKPPQGLRDTGVAADIRREHPDWTDEQGRAEYKRRMREIDRARVNRRKARLDADAQDGSDASA